MQRKKLRQQGKLSFQPDGFLQLVLCHGRILPPLGRLRIIGSREPEAKVISSVFHLLGHTSHYNEEYLADIVILYCVGTSPPLDT